MRGYRLWRIRVWMMRIIFFPIWIMLLLRGPRKERLLCSKCNKPFPREDLLADDGSFLGWCVTCDGEPEPTKLKEDVPDTDETIKKPEPAEDSLWSIHLIRLFDGSTFAKIKAELVEQNGEAVLKASYKVPCAVTFKRLDAYFGDKRVAMKTFECFTQFPDLLVLSFTLNMKEKQEPNEEVKNDNHRRLMLMTANASACKQGAFPVNHFALNDNGDLEDLGKSLEVRYIEHYPHAMWIREDGSIRHSYDPNCDLFMDIKKKADIKTYVGRAMYGTEFMFSLEETAEHVIMFCGTKSARLAAKSIKREVGALHSLTSKVMKTAKYEWRVPYFTQVKEPLLWMGKQIPDLEDKRLWNIIQAVKKGHWASGKSAYFDPEMEEALLTEYGIRKANGRYSKKKVKKIKRQNKKYEVKFCTHGRDPYKTYTDCEVCKRKKELLEQQNHPMTIYDYSIHPNRSIGNYKL